MDQLTTESHGGLSAILICPDVEMSQQVADTLRGLEAVAILASLRDYPSNHELTDRVHRNQPDVVLIDVSTQRNTALKLIAQVVDYWPHISAIAVSRSGDPEAILHCLRSGASEFLSSPFSSDDAEQAIQRILRRKAVETPHGAPQRGSLLAFAPAKGGAGATTIASHTAYWVQKKKSTKVLLADFHLTGGLISFLFRTKHNYSVTDAIKHSGQLDPALWSALVVEHDGVDILAAPERPEASAVDSYPIQEVLEYARSVYEYVIVDLGSVWADISFATLPLANSIYLVCGSDMPSLYSMRRCIQVLEETGYNRDQIRILVNRVEKRSDLSREDMEKIFRCPVHATFSNDPSAIEKALRDGVIAAEKSDFGRSMTKFVTGFLAERESNSKSFGVGALKELFSGT